MDYIGRKTWGAKFAAGSDERAIPTAEAWLHHTATKTLPVTATVQDECAQMRVVERIGQERFGAGFSYNLALFPSGRAYVGCGVRRIGSHTARRNTRALGVVLVGNFSEHPVPPPMQDALVEVLRDGYRLGWIDRPAFDGGHRDLKPTGCPGDHAYALLPTINQRASGLAPLNAEPTMASYTPALTTGGPAMILVLASDGRQFVCGPTTAAYVDGPQRAVLIAGGVPFVGGEQASPADRDAFLKARGVTGL